MGGKKGEGRQSLKIWILKTQKKKQKEEEEKKK